MGSPFDPWMATYQQGAVVGRPWWGPCSGGFRRCDGREVMAYAFVAEQEASPGVMSESIRGRSAEEMLAEMARIDTTHPLPVPPPMCGQVWVTANGDEATVAAKAHGIPFMAGLAPSAGVRIVASAHDLNVCLHPAPTWPPPNAVLVSGPHAPWAPVGWKP